jgi:hypothetical protein
VKELTERHDVDHESTGHSSTRKLIHRVTCHVDERIILVRFGGIAVSDFQNDSPSLPVET